MNQVSRVGAYAVLVKDEEILLCQLTRSRMWTLPGGGIEFKEQPIDAMICEVHEETGYRVAEQSLLGVNSHSAIRDANEIHAINIVYLAQIMGGTLRFEASGSTDSCAWFNYSDLVSTDLSDVAQFALDELNISSK